MNPVKLPTDNLYKFLSISGTILIILGYYMSNVALQGARTNLYHAEVDGVNHATKLAEFRTVLDSIEANSVKNNDADLGTLFGSLEDLETLTESFNKYESQQKIFQLFHETQNSRIDDLQRWSNIALGIGYTTAATGYVAWYFRKQRHEDKILADKSGLINKKSVSKSPQKRNSGSQK